MKGPEIRGRGRILQPDGAGKKGCAFEALVDIQNGRECVATRTNGQT